MTTFGDFAAARSVVRELVERELVACGTILPGATSIYRWEGELCEEEEVLVLLKAAGEQYPAIEKALGDLHPYDEPEIVALDFAAASPGYLAFLLGESR
ncbi:divalent-cation tolerance protein CutA [Roseibacillus ishigakijimensis]|uniref:Divalent-cation tolerance protein CutA n=1 Tax=Roseibacillus ishigakijimensis TaxID=454146 RepID=A0A934RL45_9BACT|nr:divalent cation tolerance protein CutA [Roseibacillus ishigakijimensis]MBK1832750.1 divalent-cation tolerance protein CutA [Roseibacillus ishigakijimensis]